MAVVLGVFTALGFATCVLVFWAAPAQWPGLVLAASAAGLGGATGWAAVCGRLSQPAWWRAALAGALGGVLLHPYLFLLVGCLSGEFLSPSDLLKGCLFSLLVVGVITVPMGILAALCCRALSLLRTPWGGQAEGSTRRVLD
jgi:hypothetical protein